MNPVESATIIFTLDRCRRLAISRLIAAAAFLVPAVPVTEVVAQLRAEGPQVFLLDGTQLHTTRQRIASGDPQLTPAFNSLRREANRALTVGPFSVIDKPEKPPSGDEHDYMSLAPYWWPNPDTKDGLPYIRRDGQANPEIRKLSNRHDLGELSESVETLALAYYFTRREKYAERVTHLIRVWFLDPKTRMNPNLQFAQAIRGVNSGRGQGLIESRLFTKIVDAIGLLQGSKAWTPDDQQRIENWFDAFLEWLLTSEHGRYEMRQKNNHGTYYDIQVATFALFLRKTSLATEVLEAAKTKRIAVQIEPDGRQPLELARTKAWGYSTGNLSGLMSLARLGEHVGVDLWHFKTSDGRSIRAALDFLIPYGVGAKKWPYEQIGGFSGDSIHGLLRRAAAKYPDGPYGGLLSKRRSVDPASRSNLLFSRLEQSQPLPEK